MSLTLQVLRTSLAAGPGDPRIAGIFTLDEQRVLWSASSLGAQAPPNWMQDLGSGLIKNLHQRLLHAPPEHVPWLARAVSSLIGLVLQCRMGARWSAPEGTPVFMEVFSQKAQPLLISPLRLVLDSMVPSGSNLVNTYKRLLEFPPSGDMPFEMFRISPYDVMASRRLTWQWAWGLVAAAGRFEGGRWDLDFSPGSLSRITALVRGGHELGMSGVALQAVDREEARQWMWLRHAASAYLAETFYAMYSSYGLRIHAEAGTPGSALLFGPNCVSLGEVLDNVRAGDLGAIERLQNLLAR